MKPNKCTYDKYTPTGFHYYYMFQHMRQFVRLMYEIPEDGTDVPQHVGVVKDYTDMFVICAYFWFYILTE